MVPPDLQENVPKIYTLAKTVASNVFLEDKIGGVQVGTQCKRTTALPSTRRGRLILWNRSMRSNYVMKELSTTVSITLASHGPWQDCSFALFYSYDQKEEPNDSYDHTPDLDDIVDPESKLPWQPSPWPVGAQRFGHREICKTLDTEIA